MEDMSMRVAKAVTLTVEERTTLLKWSRGRSTPARLVQRANIVLAAAEGRRNDEIAADLGCTRHTVGTWRNRFASNRLEGIQKDAPRGGRKPTRRAAVAAEIVRKTTQEKPANATHWSTRSLAKVMNVSDSMVRRVWRDSGLKPHLVKTFKLSNARRRVCRCIQAVWAR
jgi:transposase